jgi:hypothetical protein
VQSQLDEAKQEIEAAIAQATKAKISTIEESARLVVVNELRLAVQNELLAVENALQEMNNALNPVVEASGHRGIAPTSPLATIVISTIDSGIFKKRMRISWRSIGILVAFWMVAFVFAMMISMR